MTIRQQHIKERIFEIKHKQARYISQRFSGIIKIIVFLIILLLSLLWNKK